MCGLEDVVGADQVDAHRAHRALAHSVDAGDRRAVDDVRYVSCKLAHELGVEDVAFLEREVRMLGEIRAGERVAVQVVERDDLVRIDQPAGERRSDEARPAGDQHAFAVQGHARECIGGSPPSSPESALLAAAHRTPIPDERPDRTHDPLNRQTERNERPQRLRRYRTSVGPSGLARVSPSGAQPSRS